MTAESTFRAKAPGIMHKLIDDFPIGVEDAAAILGNLGHESGGLVSLQELKPTVAGSAGGYGWAQWTGPRRRAFEAYCARNGLKPSSDKANYAWLFLELKGTEKGAIAAVVAADGLDEKVEAFERAFERAGVKHYPSRKQWAAIALDAFEAAPVPAEPIVTQPAQEPAVPVTPPVTQPTAPLPANPSPTPVEQASKSVGAGKWTAIVGTLWTTISAFLLATPSIPEQYRDPVLLAGIGTLLTTLASIIGAYAAPQNAVPSK